MNQQESTQTLLCIAHRGAMGHAPENTIASIQKALELGAPCIEIDVYSVNGDLLVIHDERLERTTNGKGKLWEHDFGYLRSLDAGNGERIPTLAEVCGEIDGKACLNIELKGANVAADVVYFIQNMLDPDVSCWRREQLLISSFDHRALEQVHKLDPSLNLAALGYSIPTSYAHFAQELGAIAVNPSLELIDQVYVDDAHARGLKVYVYTVNEPEDIQAMAAMGVDGVFTNYPERVLAHYQQPDLNKGWTS